MADMKEEFEDIIEALKQQRDELKVRMHLGSMDAKEEFEALEKKWDHWLAEAKAESKPLRRVIEESAKDVGSGLEQVLDEVKHSYERIRKQLESDD